VIARERSPDPSFEVRVTSAFIDAWWGRSFLGNQIYPVIPPRTRGLFVRDDAMDTGLRPVFFEELDLLGLSNRWNYPTADQPILWAKSRRYFYKGEVIMKTIGGGIFSKPSIELKRDVLDIKPESIEKDIGHIVYNTLDLIASTIEKHKREHDAVVVSFSGGKDSTVLLDLINRAISPDEFVVVFNDTTMELPTTYEAVAKARERYPNLSFYTARSEILALETWRLYAPPNRFDRWCRRVHKSEPNLKLIKSIVGDGRILVITGTRRSESNLRSRYSVLDEPNKKIKQTNFNAMLDWTLEDIWQYILQRDLFINKAYRYGMKRVGCILCPFLSGWDSFISGHVFYKETRPFLEILVEYAVAKGIKDVRDFIASGKWRSKILRPKQNCFEGIAITGSQNT
jgi:phosphoadenosine phosphosulfate reductase